MEVTKALFPVAGLGTRFLPATKAIPKEMLPIVDMPLIQYAVEEASVAGIREFVFITGKTKRSIEDHFDINQELENKLFEDNKHELLKTLKAVTPNSCSFIFIRQSHPAGLGDAILHAAPCCVKDEPVAILLADDYIVKHNHNQSNCTQDLIKVYNERPGIVIAVEKVDSDKISQYGIVGGEKIDEKTIKVTELVEKPDVKLAPSDLGIIGRYILPYSIFKYIRQTNFGINGEVQLTDAILSTMKECNATARILDGSRFDCGSKLGYIKATIKTALSNAQLKKDLVKYLTELDVTKYN